MENINILKNKIRNEIKEIRKNISENLKNNYDDKILSSLVNLSDFNKAEQIFIYVSSEYEIDTLKIIEYALEHNKKVAVPYCIDLNGNMTFYYINSFENLIVGSYNLLEPDITVCKEVTDYKNSIIVLPGLSFDKYGNRLGYGKGYFDRFLKDYLNIKIGLCYNECMQNKLPVDKYDQKVNYIVTQNDIIKVL